MLHYLNGQYSVIVKRKDWDDTIKRIVKAVRSKKQSVILSMYSGGDTHMTGWDGGSKSNLVRVTTAFQVEPLELTLDDNRMGDPFKQRMITPKELPENTLAVVKVGVSCGKAATPGIQIVENTVKV
jgi:hypothetical protein